MKGLALIRLIDWRTSSSASGNDSRANDGRMPTSSRICCFTASSVNVTIPQSVWWIRMISVVPSRRWEITRERMASSLTRRPRCG